MILIDLCVATELAEGIYAIRNMSERNGACAPCYVLDTIVEEGSGMSRWVMVGTLVRSKRSFVPANKFKFEFHFRTTFSELFIRVLT